MGVSVNGCTLTCRCLIHVTGRMSREPSLSASPGKEMLGQTGMSVLRPVLDGQDALSGTTLSHRLSNSGRRSIARKRRNPGSRGECCLNEAREELGNGELKVALSPWMVVLLGHVYGEPTF